MGADPAARPWLDAHRRFRDGQKAAVRGCRHAGQGGGRRGDDEINPVRKGANYGWPVVSYGFQCDGGPIGMGIPMQEGMEVPVKVFVPSITPSDLVICRGQAFAAWQGDFLLGAMAGTRTSTA